MIENNVRELTDKEKLLELKEWYSSDELSKSLDVTEEMLGNFLNDKSSFTLTNSEKLNDFFNNHVHENSKFEMIKNVYGLWETDEKQFMVDTPDGFQFVSEFIHKDSRSCFDLRTDNFHIECSGDHLIETDKGWVKTEDIVVGSKVLTRVGFEEVKSNAQLSDSDVYDMTVEHDNHRYWGGAGISSHNSGKSFLMAKAIVEAQKEGYMVAVLDSEQAVSQDYLKKIGVDLDPSMLMTVQVQTVEQTQDMLLEVLEGVKEEQEALGNTKELKLLLIVDSIGMLSSGKALANAEAGHHAADMGTKAKALTNMFNQIVQKVGITETVCLVTNHGALEVGVMFPQLKPKGGQCLVAGTKVQTDKGYKNIEEIQVGDMVRTHLNQIKPVEKLFSFDNLDILNFELETGQNIKMSKDHKMLVLRNGEKLWLEAQFITTYDSLLALDV
jgi:RecA/RadA recombinase